MTTAKDLLKNKSFEEMQRLFQSARGESLASDEELKKSKGLGNTLIINATQIPNEVVDEWLCHLTGNEMKVLIYLIRKTFGYKKYAGDKIPLSQIMTGTQRKDGSFVDHGTGLARPTVISAIRTLERVGLIHTEKTKKPDGSNGTTFYSLSTRDDYGV